MDSGAGAIRAVHRAGAATLSALGTSRAAPGVYSDNLPRQAGGLVRDQADQIWYAQGAGAQRDDRDLSRCGCTDTGVSVDRAVTDDRNRGRVRVAGDTGTAGDRMALLRFVRTSLRQSTQLACVIVQTGFDTGALVEGRSENHGLPG